MTQINFYNLQQDTEQMRKLFACRLTEKALSLGHRVCLFAGSEAIASEIDALLWSFSSTSFPANREGTLAWASRLFVRGQRGDSE